MTLSCLGMSSNTFHTKKYLCNTSSIFLLPVAYFFGFPPWQNPWRTSTSMSKQLSKMPYIHLLPATSYRKLLIKHGEDPTSLLEVKETGISIERFECIVHRKTTTSSTNNFTLSIRITKSNSTSNPVKYLPSLGNYPIFETFIPLLLIISYN